MPVAPVEFDPISEQKRRVLALAIIALAGVAAAALFSPIAPRVAAIAAASAAQVESAPNNAVTIDYPEQGSIFPPGITPPTIIWRDSSATSWQITVTFSDNSPAIHAESKGQHMQVGAIDPRCVAATNKPPELNAQQAASWVWTPDAATWSAIQLHSKAHPATLAITGYRNGRVVSPAGQVAFTTSADEVGAPIFYRDVPLMPTANTEGVVQPLASDAIHLIQWRLRDIRRPDSHTVLHDVPTCLNCHSFARDGKTMGIDLDGPQNDKGLYAITPISRNISIDNRKVVQWNVDGTVGKIRVGFMSQVSPSGRYVISTFSGTSLEFQKAFYVRNFTNYKFLQVFYPTRGILEYYDRTEGKRHPLPGASDPRYVQTGGVWSPDGKYIVFARAEARNPYTDGKPLADYANDPNETQIQYDLYRIPFNDGKGGEPERIIGASQNGMSNSFPKVSPDGKWIVFVQAKNGEVMRPDSKLYIVPFQGGEARPLRSNLYPMNSWHSWSPNGRWLVFSSKARSPYTQMYLTHIDADGNSSPAILVDNTTASNRAVNLPEFVNIAGDGIEDIQVPAIHVYRLIEQAIDLEEKKEYDKALGVLQEAATLAPDDARVHSDLAADLYLEGKVADAIAQERDAVRINPMLVQAHYNLGAFLMQQGHPDQALPELERALEVNPRFPQGEETLAGDFAALGKDSEALTHWRKALELSPQGVNAFVGAARILSSSRDNSVRNGAEAVTLAEKANDITAGKDPTVLDALAAAYAESGQYSQAVSTAQRALDLATTHGDASLVQGIRYRMSLYQSNKPFRI